MNIKAIYEIGELIHVTRNWKFQKLTAEQILQTHEFKMFRDKYPELAKLVLEDKNASPSQV